MFPHFDQGPGINNHLWKKLIIFFTGRNWHSTTTERETEEILETAIKRRNNPKDLSDLREDVTVNPDHSLFYSRNYCPV